MPKRDITLHIEGHPGHRGNVLAHALVDKLRKLLSALAQAERTYLDAAQRQTEYEIVNAEKVNPTNLTFHPVPKRATYDPLPAFEWTLEQLERVETGGEIDERLDSSFAQTLAELAEKKREDDYSRLWISDGHRTINLDARFKARSEAIAAKKIEIETPPQWFEGASLGTVVGDLRQVADIEGEHQFVIIPPIGAERITCTFPEAKRELMRKFLFKTVRVFGRLTYTKDSPFPVRVAMDDIEAASEFENPPHLLDLRGLFKGIERSNDDLEHLNGV
ncbi:MAG: hypothetical protein ACRC1G_21760 [Bradyrhizobium sp.]|nr:hypothetical protein [Bradyrhizobium sp.]